MSRVRRMYHEKEEWIRFLSGKEWDYYMTLTFKGTPSESHARRAANNFMKMHPSPELAFIVFEGFGRVNPHLHGLIKFPSPQKPTASSLCERWYERNGQAKIEPPESVEAAAGYCCKHLTPDSYELYSNGK